MKFISHLVPLLEVNFYLLWPRHFAPPKTSTTTYKKFSSYEAFFWRWNFADFGHACCWQVTNFKLLRRLLPHIKTSALIKHHFGGEILVTLTTAAIHFTPPDSWQEMNFKILRPTTTTYKKFNPYVAPLLGAILTFDYAYQPLCSTRILAGYEFWNS